MDFIVPDAYITDGRPVFRFFAIDSDGNFNYILWGDMFKQTPDDDNRFTLTKPNMNVSTITFDQTEVTSVGVVIQTGVTEAKPAPRVSTSEHVFVDNVILRNHAANKIATDPNFESDFPLEHSAAWSSSVPLAISFGAIGGVKSVSYKPGSTETQYRNLVYKSSDFLDLSNATITMNLSVNQSFLDSGASLQVMAQRAGDDYAGAYCSAVPADTEWFRVECPVEGALTLGNATEFQYGVQTLGGDGNADAKVSIYNIQVTPQSN